MQNNKLLNINTPTQQNKLLQSLQNVKNIQNKIIGTVKINKDNSDVTKKITEIEKVRTDEVSVYWKNRTNQTYKPILNIDNNKKITSADDLIIHKVTKSDKNGVEKQLDDYKKQKETYNKELKTLYSVDNKLKHKEKFEYNHIYKFRDTYDPKDHNILKQDKIKYYQEQQKNMELEKQKINIVLEGLINNGIFNQDEINSFIAKK